MKYKKHKCKRISRKYFDKIKISAAFQKHPPKPFKFLNKAITFLSKHKLSPLIVDENYILVDGYCSWILAKECGYKGHKLRIYMAKGFTAYRKQVEKEKKDEH